MIEYVKRFSMCNCLTLDFPETYTAFALTVDRFLRQVVPGELLILPHSELRSKEEKFPRAYKIPLRIDTFMFSPFNEAYNTMFDCGNGIMSSCIGRRIKAISEKMGKLSPSDLASRLPDVDRKVEKLWGSVLRILVLYDNTWATDEIKANADLYDEAAINAVKNRWQIIRVECGVNVPGSKPGRAGSKPWLHYTWGAKKAVIRKIEDLEREHGKKRKKGNG